MKRIRHANRTPEIVGMGECLLQLAALDETEGLRGRPFAADLAGAESNALIGLARLGHRVRWLSAVGTDPFGERMLETLTAEGVDVGAVIRDPARPTGVMFKTLAKGAARQVLYYRNTSACASLDAGAFGDAALAGAKGVLLSGITPALSAGCRRLFFDLLSRAARLDVPVLFDLNLRPRLWPVAQAKRVLRRAVPFAHTLFAGDDEITAIMGGSDPIAAARRCLSLGVRCVVIKQGAAGATAVTATEQIAAPPPDVPVVDTVGAGDAFNAGFIAAWLGRKPLADCLAWGNAAGAAVCRDTSDWRAFPGTLER